MKKIKVLIVDDSALIRKLLSEIIGSQPDMEAIGSAPDPLVAREMIRELNPDVLTLDVEMPKMDGVDAIAAGSSFYPSIKFVVLTIFDDEEKIFKAIKAGAYGYLLKDESAENIAEMLWQMHENGAGPISPGIAHKILQLVQKNELTIKKAKANTIEKNFFDLSQREMEILQLLVQGLFYKEIGQKLNISTNTAKKHVVNIYQKLHVNSRAQALHLAYEKGLL